MFSFIFRLLWRVLIFLLGVALAWLAITKIYPYADSQLPAFVVIFLFYCLFAYGVVPLLFRLLRIVIKPNHIPLYVTTSDGWPSDPVNIAIIARSCKQLTKKMHAAGWDTADPLTFKNGALEVLSIILNRAYRKAPLSNLYLFNRPHDIGFEISTSPTGSARTRHHVRFWRLEEPLNLTERRHQAAYAFWSLKLRQFMTGGKELWIGAATEETRPIDVQWRTGQLTHGGSHESDKERDFIIASLANVGAVAKVYTSESGDQIRFRGQQVRTFYVSDGSIKIIHLK